MAVVASLALSLAAAPPAASVAPSPGTGETTDPRLYRDLSGWLSTQPLDPALKNPLCGATKWGLKAIAYAANIACCVGGVPACVVCTLGLDDVKDAIKGIDCNKECKPDCPIG
jgi:hypothetical protein